LASCFNGRNKVERSTDLFNLEVFKTLCRHGRNLVIYLGQ
jgi:hypothetical protein